jgi:hypothetical protein
MPQPTGTDQSFGFVNKNGASRIARCACRSPRRSWLTADPRALFGTKESVDLFANSNGAFEIGEMSAILQCDHASIWDSLSDVLGRSGGDEFVIARDD